MAYSWDTYRSTAEDTQITHMWVLDAIKLTNAETTDEIHSDRVHEMEITVVKDVEGKLFSGFIG